MALKTVGLLLACPNGRQDVSWVFCLGMRATMAIVLTTLTVAMRWIMAPAKLTSYGASSLLRPSIGLEELERRPVKLLSASADQHETPQTLLGFGLHRKAAPKEPTGEDTQEVPFLRWAAFIR